MRLNTKIAAMAVTAGLGIAAFVAPQQAEAGISIAATANGSNITGLNGASALPGTDPVTQPGREIVLGVNDFTTNVGGTTLSFAGLRASQSYTPAVGPVGGITQALGDSTSISIRNLGNVAATLRITLTFDTYNYPIDNPLSWLSTIATTRLNGGATYDSTETIGGVVVNHNTLTAPGSESITTSVSPGRPFTLVQVLDIFLPAGAVANIQKSDTLTATVPEPASLALLGAGLLGLAAVRRARRRDEA